MISMFYTFEFYRVQTFPTRTYIFARQGCKIDSFVKYYRCLFIIPAEVIKILLKMAPTNVSSVYFLSEQLKQNIKS